MASSLTLTIVYIFSVTLQNNNDVYSHKVKEHLKPYDDNNESKAEPAGINCSQPNNMPTINITGQFLFSILLLARWVMSLCLLINTRQREHL